MPSANNSLPDDGSDLGRWQRDISRRLQQLEAAKRLASTAIGSGGVTVQADGTGQRIVIAPVGAIEVVAGAGFTQPPGMMFYSGDPGEQSPGEVTAYLEDTGTDLIPTVLAITSDLGYGPALLKLQAGTPDSGDAAAELSVGEAQLILGASAMTVEFADGTAIGFSADGVEFESESWTALTLQNSWTATGGTWQVPIFHLGIDLMVSLEGSATPGTLTAGTVITALPSGYVPPADLEYRVPGGSGTAYCDLVVHGLTAAAPGTVTITNVAGTITRISLSGIRFSL